MGFKQKGGLDLGLGDTCKTVGTTTSSTRALGMLKIDCELIVVEV